MNLWEMYYLKKENEVLEKEKNNYLLVIKKKTKRK